MRCHYLQDGTINFAFTLRKAEYFIPAGLLLKCFFQVGGTMTTGGRSITTLGDFRAAGGGCPAGLARQAASCTPQQPPPALIRAASRVESASFQLAATLPMLSLLLLLQLSDQQLYDALIGNTISSTQHMSFLVERVQLMMHQMGAFQMRSKADVLAHLGR